MCLNKYLDISVRERKRKPKNEKGGCECALVHSSYSNANRNTTQTGRKESTQKGKEEREVLTRNVYLAM
jgi:hypothetical protein